MGMTPRRGKQRGKAGDVSDHEVAADVAAIHARLAGMATGPSGEGVAEEIGAIRAHLLALADSNAEIAARLAEVVGRQ
jgi:hypothetical protein